MAGDLCRTKGPLDDVVDGGITGAAPLAETTTEAMCA